MFHATPDNSEGDNILMVNLKMLGIEAALKQWPEYKSLKFDFKAGLFSTPNRTGMEIIIYFLLCHLESRESISKLFKNIWPPRDAGQVRDFRSKSVEIIK